LVKFGLNIGNEQNGKWDYLRPVLVFKKLRGVFLCIPLTSQGKHPIYHYKLPDSWNRESYLVFNQIRVLDKRRFVHKMRNVSLENFEIIKKLFHKVLFTEESFGS
jgi:mRNA-degrading endonuclease toxin of MazEF toxin-antitoxin module